MKIQHSLRAFTAKDRKAIKLAAENFPDSEYYQVDKLLTELGVGEALVTVLNEKASPTPLVCTLICSLESSMEIISEQQLNEVVSQSHLASIYNKEIDRESAYEILNAKIQNHLTEKESSEVPEEIKTKTATNKKSPGIVSEIGKSPLARQVGHTLVRELTRGIFGVLGGASKRR